MHLYIYILLLIIIYLFIYIYFFTGLIQYQRFRDDVVLNSKKKTNGFFLKLSLFIHTLFIKIVKVWLDTFHKYMFQYTFFKILQKC